MKTAMAVILTLNTIGMTMLAAFLIDPEKVPALAAFLGAAGERIECNWKWLALSVYLAFVWLVAGPAWTRSMYRQNPGWFMYNPPAELCWLFAPLWMPFYPVGYAYPLLSWLLYGRIK